MMGRPQVLLLPGGMMPADMAYRPLIERIGEAAICIAKEAEIYRGDAPPVAYSFDEEVAGVVRVADEAGFEQLHLVGYSFGGLIALATAARDPERVASLAVIEPAPVRTLETTDEGDRMWAEVERMFLLPPEERGPASASILLKPGTVPPAPPPGPPPPWMASRMAAFETVMRATWLYPLDPERLARFRRPAYLALGTLSHPIFERQARRLGQLWPQLQTEPYEGLHHLHPPHLAQPDRMATTLLGLWSTTDMHSDDGLG